MKTKKLTSLIGLIIVIAMTMSLAFTAVYAEEATEPTTPTNKVEPIAVLSESANDGYTSQTGDAPSYAYKETSAADETVTNTFIRITHGFTRATWSSFALQTDVVDAAGLYKLSFDARIPDNYDSDNFSVTMWGGSATVAASVIAGNKEALLSAMRGEADQWGFKHIETTLNVPSSQTNIKFMLNVSKDAYIDIDNISLTKQVSDTTFGTENLEGTRNHNFEGFGFDGTLLKSGWANHPFTAGGDADTVTLMPNPDGGYMLKMYNSANGFASFAKDSVSSYTAGTYTAKVTVEAGSAFVSNNIGFNINKDGGTLASNVQFDRSNIATDGTDSVLTAEFTVEDYSGWTHFNMWCNNANSANENNYLLIKKIEILNSTGDNIDTLGSLPDMRILNSGAWSAGWYLPADSANNIAIVEDGAEGNHAAKLTQKNDENQAISFSYALDQSKYEAGKRYQVSFNAKAGSTFNTLNLGVGLRNQSNALVVDRIMPFNKITTSGWTKISAILDIPTGVVLNGNLDIWLFGKSGADENSYVLIDNIELVTVSDPVWSADLLADKADGSMEKIEEGAIPALKEIPAYTGYYAHKMIQLGNFESFAENFRFGAANESTQYWGANTQYDAPATIVKDGENQLMKIKYDDNPTHNFASSFVMIDQEMWSADNVYVLKFSYKLSAAPTHAKVAFISETNRDILCLDLDGIHAAGTYYTSGENTDVFAYTVAASQLGEGWYDVTVPFTCNFKFQSLANSLRFLLMTNGNAAYEMYIDNVDLTLYEEECTNHEDANGDYKCDKCGAEMKRPEPTECDKHVDENKDGKCDVCGKDMPANNNTLKIVLIVVGCVVGAGAIAAVVIILLKRRKK